MRRFEAPMNTAKRGIQHLAAICALKGITRAVISPGSRNAPIITAFLRQKEIHCHSIVDERSAAFYALGMAQQLRQPVALICTSGSAVLNFAPAIAEAYYQKIPLLVLTADRPNEWIDQGENQSIHQYRVYNNYIKKSFELPVDPESEKDLWYSDRLISEAINVSRWPDPGPVHINIPLREPLYSLTHDKEKTKAKVIETIAYEPCISDEAAKSLAAQWEKAGRKLIIAGAGNPEARLDAVLQEMAKDPNVIILSETGSNIGLDPKLHIACIDRSVDIVQRMKDDSFIPEILISFGGGIVSKKLKFLFRQKSNIEHWHISQANEHWDTFQNLSCVINENPARFLARLPLSRESHESYRDRWLTLDDTLRGFSVDYLKSLSWCDFQVFEKLIASYPAKANIHYGNSTPVRYSNLFEADLNKALYINANRGVSGIDGVSSTAAGAAMVNERLTICISGDLAFLYDSNALWNNHLPANLRIIVINNGGGNIFRIIPGPDQIEGFEDFISTEHTRGIEPLVRSFGLDYYFCDSTEGLENSLQDFYTKPERAAVLEINTPGEYSASTLKNYFTFLSEKYEQKRMANH